jgi:hypothetical protein
MLLDIGVDQPLVEMVEGGDMADPADDHAASLMAGYGARRGDSPCGFRALQRRSM